MNAPELRAPRVIADADYDRRRFIGSSNIAAIMGLAPEIGGDRHTALDVYLAKTSDQPEEMDPILKLFLERRKRWEPVVVQMLKEEFNAEIVSTNVRYVDGDCDYFAAEADFEWLDADGSIAWGEIKTVTPRAFGARFGWGEPGTGDVPVHYEAQVQWGMRRRRARRGVLVAMVGLDSMEFYPIEAADDLGRQMDDAAHFFWQHNVLARVPPPAQTIPDLHKLYKTSVSAARVDATSEVGSKALQLRAIRGNISALELQAQAFEFDVKQHMKDAEELFVDGAKLFTWKEQNWSILDQSGLKEKYPKIHKEMTKTGRRRVFMPLAGWTPQST